MFSQSQSQTPIPAGNYHEKLADTVTWVNDWYVPALSSNNETTMASLMRLKGWFKTNKQHKVINDLAIQDNEVLDLSQFPYLLVVEATEVLPEEEEPKEKLELQNALSLDKDEGQILGLGQ